jgi:hypothetical protein
MYAIVEFAVPEGDGLVETWTEVVQVRDESGQEGRFLRKGPFWGKILKTGEYEEIQAKWETWPFDDEEDRP